MIRALAIAFFVLLGTGLTGLVIWLISCLVRVGPEFPPLPPVQRDP